MSLSGSRALDLHIVVPAAAVFAPMLRRVSNIGDIELGAKLLFDLQEGTRCTIRYTMGAPIVYLIEAVIIAGGGLALCFAFV
jgi:hypothetical protein